jgi:rod shape-determining protein MreC
MHWIFRFFVRHRNLTSLLVTVALSLWMISSSPESQMVIARHLTMYVFFPIQWTLDTTRRVNNAFAENEKLKKRVAELNTRLSLLEEWTAEHERLQKLLGFEQQWPYELITVRVVARESSALFRTVVISAGKSDGVRRYMPVVDGSGLVGKVVQVLPHLSLVQLIRDPGNRTSVLLRCSRVVGILESRNGSDLFLRYRSYEQVEPGDTVVTSGLGGIYPEGLLVGQVIRTVDTKDPLFAKAVIEPFTEFDKLEEAFVMRLTPQWSSFRSELDSLDLEP